VVLRHTASHGALAAAAAQLASRAETVPATDGGRNGWGSTQR